MPGYYNKDKRELLINPTSHTSTVRLLTVLSIHCSAFVSPKSQPTKRCNLL